MQFFSYNFSVFKCASTTRKYARIYYFEAIFQKSHLREGVAPSPTLPLSALHAPVKPSDPGAQAILNRAQEEKSLDTPGKEAGVDLGCGGGGKFYTMLPSGTLGHRDRTKLVSDWEGKGPCAIVPSTWKMAHKSLCRLIRSGP